MAGGNPVWGVEIGQCALKAVKLRLTGEQQVELVAFDLIEHPKILSQPDADADELIGAALEKFASRNDWHGDRFVIGVPGQQTFSRFCKLPPVDAKKIPDIVRFEASQQIPFDMDDVVWDYQVFRAGQVPDVEVGIFAMRKDLIRKYIDYFSGIGIAPAAVQTIPSALYNFCRFDGQGGEGTTVIIDVGAQNTDLIIAEPNSAWMRNIPLGGNSFTEALIKAFKLSFAKAESLKRTAATSKYARQIFQAMRPVFAELVAEIQRSIGFYSSTHREMELQRVLACGNAFRLPGLQKYLENNLTISGGVTRLEKFKALVPSATINAPQFAENILSFAPAYGLALQGLELAALGANLLPPELARIALWKKKRPLFVAAAACLGLAALCPWARSMIDASALRAGRPDGDDAERIVDNARELNRRFQAVSADTGQWQRNIDKLLDLQKHKRLIPHIIALVHDAMPEPAVQGEAGAMRSGEPPLLIDSLTIRHVNTERQVVQTIATGDLGVIHERPSPGRPGSRRQALPEHAEDVHFYVHLAGRLPSAQKQDEAARLLMDEFAPRLAQLGRRPGLGFHVPTEKTATRSRPAVELLHLGPHFEDKQEAAEEPRFEEGGVSPHRRFTQPPVPTPGASAPTGWRFEIGFGLKLGPLADGPG